MDKKKNNKCYIYIRVSTSMQVEGYSLEAQRERLTRYAKYEKLEIVREYCDAGKSGKNIFGRPEFTQMLQDVAENRDGIRYILVFKLSRFGRNAADVLNSLQHIQDYGVDLICVEDGIDSSRDSGKLTITVLSAVAEIERENILVQTMEGRRQKAREGKWNGGLAPFGYRQDKENDSLVVEPKEAEVVRLVYEKYANEGVGVEAICKYLNQHGYVKEKMRDRDLEHFTSPLIHRILTNPVYLGKIAYGKLTTEKIKGTRDQYHRVKSEDYLLVDGRHEALIDEELWLAAQERRKELAPKKNRPHKLAHEHILSGLIKCPVCGNPLVGTVRRRKNAKTGKQEENFYYRCLHRKTYDGEHLCYYRPSLNQEETNKRVEEVVLEMVNDTTFREYIQKKLEEKVDVSALEKERDQLKAQLRQHEGASRKLMEMLDQLQITDRHYDRKYRDMHERLDNLYDKINEVEDAITEVDEKISAVYRDHLSAKQVYRIMEHFGKLYAQMTDQEKKTFFQLFIDSIEIDPEKSADEQLIRQITFRFPLYYNGREGEILRLLKNNADETCCSMVLKDQ